MVPSLFSITLKCIIAHGNAENIPMHLKPEISRIIKKRPLFENVDYPVTKTAGGTYATLCIWCPFGCMTPNQRILYGHSELVPKYALTKKQMKVHVLHCDEPLCNLQRLHTEISRLLRRLERSAAEIYLTPIEKSRTFVHKHTNHIDVKTKRCQDPRY